MRPPPFTEKPDKSQTNFPSPSPKAKPWLTKPWAGFHTGEEGG